MSGPAAPRKIFVACLGNPDRGDDGIGALVAKALAGRLPADVALIARGGDMLALIDDWAGFDALICVDAAVPISGPGRIHRLDLATDALPAEMAVTSSHAFGLADAIRLARTLGQAPQEIIVYAVEGHSFDPGAAVTPAVADGIDEVAQRVVAEVTRLRPLMTLPHAR
ncbi:MAG: hydrogenase maturation protease [Pseudolabrys sp.]